MRSISRITFILLSLLLCSGANPSTLYVLDVTQLNGSQVEQIKSAHGVEWWSELGEELVIAGTITLDIHSPVAVKRQFNNVSKDDLKILIASHPNDRPQNIRLISSWSRVSLVQMKGPISKDLDHYKVENFTINKAYVQSGSRIKVLNKWSPQMSSSAQEIMEKVDSERWYQDVKTLSGWNRHIGSTQNLVARDWIKQRFETLSPTSLTLQKFTVSGKEAWNVVATFDGTTNANTVIIGGHYDSISERPSQSAPGAEDNATGTAGILELARIMATEPHAAKLVFIAFSGEEQNLYGSTAYVQNLTSEERSKIKAVLNMDMIGYTASNQTNVLLETSNAFRTLHDTFANASKLVGGLKFYSSFNPFGSDHMPFIDRNIPAILTIDDDYEKYPSYHRSTDTLDKVSKVMGVAILKMNAAALLDLANPRT